MEKKKIDICTTMAQALLLWRQWIIIRLKNYTTTIFIFDFFEMSYEKEVR